MTDITSIGEILIDLTQQNINEQNIPCYLANPGGAPANLAVAAAKLGASAAFIGKVGNDSFGKQLIACLKEYGVNTGNIIVDKNYSTTLAVVSIDENGERSFSFYRNPGADTNLQIAELSTECLTATRYLHFGSVSLTADPCYSTTLYAVKKAKEHGAIITYDPNYRANLWSDKQTALSRMKEPLPLVDILKLSEEELPLLTEITDLEQGTKRLASYGISLILVTLGADGAYYRFQDFVGHVAGIPCNVGDTNGAGDTFFGALLSRLVKFSDLSKLTVPELEKIILFANKAASITTSRHGAIPAMPSLDEITE